MNDGPEGEEWSVAVAVLFARGLRIVSSISSDRPPR